MNGINILESIEVVTNPYEGISLVVSCIIMCIFAGFMGYRAAQEKKEPFKLPTKILFGFLAVGYIASLVSAFYMVPGKTQYKCTIDDTVTIGDLEEHYNILNVTTDESGDQIFLLEEK